MCVRIFNQNILSSLNFVCGLLGLNQRKQSCPQTLFSPLNNASWYFRCCTRCYFWWTSRASRRSSSRWLCVRISKNYKKKKKTVDGTSTHAKWIVIGFRFILRSLYLQVGSLSWKGSRQLDYVLGKYSLKISKQSRLTQFVVSYSEYTAIT